MNRLRNLDIKYLKGIGPKRAELLGKQLGIKSYRDLLYHFPTRYLDRSSIYRVKDLSGEMPMIQLKGRFIAMTVQGEGAKTRLVGVFTDGTGTMEVVWFRRIKQIRESYHTGNEYIIFGKPELFNNRWSMVHPEVDTPASTTAAQGLRGVYPLTETLRNQGIGARQIFTWVQTALAASPVITETLPRSIIERLKLMSLRESLINIHNPQSNEKLQAARLRLKFEELFYIQLNIQRYSRRRNAQLTGSTRKKERDIIHSQLTDGSLHILIGTHAVIEDNVQFKNLGFVVIDEQHRFGVAQRARLWQKNMVVPHVLVMTATPIPRTLAMTIYGDLSVSVIDELPPGRKPVTTLLRYDNNRMAVYQALGKQLKQGRQAYIVYPLIQENEKLDLKCLEEGYEMIRETFRDYKVCYVHGKMKPAEKEHQMMLFATNQAQILVATTVIEVGVNVPNASTMIIENAERFGLSQLHQLRGRVGRGADQSYCILMTHQKIQKETRQRLEIMTSTTDGFVIAEADLKMRGPGDMEGTMQSGIAFDLHIANLATDGQIVQLARDAADDTLDKDPELALPENSILRSELLQQASKAVDWSRIS